MNNKDNRERSKETPARTTRPMDRTKRQSDRQHDSAAPLVPPSRSISNGIPPSSETSVAAAVPPTLRSSSHLRSTTPGAICVPGLSSSTDEDEHDNLLDLDDSGRSHLPSSSSTPSANALSIMSTPIVAELAPFYNEQDVEDRLAERLEAQMERQISQRLQQEVDRRWSQQQEQYMAAQTAVLAEVLPTVKPTNNNPSLPPRRPSSRNQKDPSNKGGKVVCCGIRRGCWGLILFLLVLLVAGGIGGSFLWYSGVLDKNKDENFTTRPSSNPSSAPPSANGTFVPMAPTLPSSNNRTVMPEANSTDDDGDDDDEDLPIVNLTMSPSQVPSPVDPTAPPTTDLRRTYLINRLGPLVVHDKFRSDPEEFFETEDFRKAALEWMATEENVFSTPVPVLMERYVLAVLYFATGGNETWTDSYHFLSPRNVCDWNNNIIALVDNDIISDDRLDASLVPESTITPELRVNTLDGTSFPMGVFCTNESPFVTSIELPNNGLSGSIPWELSLLQSIIKIDFDTNALVGSIPTTLGSLSNSLQALWCKGNQLNGSLPSELAKATQLASIDLEDNLFESTLPSEWFALTDLFYIGLRLNKLNGTLPVQWNKLAKLEVLDLGGNQLTGRLPGRYGGLTNLESLYLESNQLQGSLPVSYSNLTRLQNLFVDDNLLTGNVPVEYSGLSNLDYFWFQGNQLVGNVDPIFCENNALDLRADCLGDPPEIECSCCSQCCDPTGANCVEVVSRR